MEKLEHGAPLVGRESGGAAVENSMAFSKKETNIELPSDPAMSPLGAYPKARGAESPRAIRTRPFTAALFAGAQRRKQPKCPSTEDGCPACSVHTRPF